MRMKTALFTPVFLLVLTGCSLIPTAPPTVENGLGIHGKAYGGQQPVSGAHIYVYAAAASAYEADVSPVASVPLLDSRVATNNPANYGQDGDSNYYVTTDANGNFHITGDYTCTAGQQVYLYAIGGDSGGGANSAIGLLAALGDCPVDGTFASSISFVIMNEVSTIAAAYAMAGFALDATHVSYGGSALGKTGITNAFANAANLDSLSGGLALDTTPNGNGVVPQTTINTLANILASCINTSGPGSAGCSTLFTNMKSGGASGTTATDTATSAIYFAHNPYPGSAQMTALYSGITPTPPFSPALTGPNPPNDFSISITFTGDISEPAYLAVDGSGNVWITDNGSSGNKVIELSSAGVPATGSPFTGGGLSAPFAIAIDNGGGVWVTNRDGVNNNVTKLTSAGAAAPNSPFTVGTGEGYGIAIDAGGNAWTSDYGGSNSVYKLNPDGSTAAGSPFSGSGINGPLAIAIDGASNVWITDYGSDSISELTSTGAAAAGSPFTGNGLGNPYAIAMDGSGSAWITNYFNDSITKLASDGTNAAGSPFTGGGLFHPDVVAIDGSGNAWIGNAAASTLTELSSTGAALSPSTGFTSAGLSVPQSVAIDGSGNVWAANAGSSTVTEFLGIATPVVTPIAIGVANNTLGSRP